MISGTERLLLRDGKGSDRVICMETNGCTNDGKPKGDLGSKEG